MKKRIAIVLCLTICCALAASTHAAEKKKSRAISGKVATVDTEKNEIVIDLRKNQGQVRVPINEKLRYQIWTPCAFEDIPDGAYVGVWTKFKEGDEKVLGNATIVEYTTAGKGQKGYTASYKVVGYLHRDGEKKTLEFTGKTLPLELGEKIRILRETYGALEDVQPGCSVSFPTTDEGDVVFPTHKTVRVQLQGKK